MQGMFEKAIDYVVIILTISLIGLQFFGDTVIPSFTGWKRNKVTSKGKLAMWCLILLLPASIYQYYLNEQARSAFGEKVVAKVDTAKNEILSKISTIDVMPILTINTSQYKPNPVLYKQPGYYIFKSILTSINEDVAQDLYHRLGIVAFENGHYAMNDFSKWNKEPDVMIYSAPFGGSAYEIIDTVFTDNVNKANLYYVLQVKYNNHNEVPQKPIQFIYPLRNEYINKTVPFVNGNTLFDIENFLNNVE